MRKIKQQDVNIVKKTRKKFIAKYNFVQVGSPGIWWCRNVTRSQRPYLATGYCGKTHVKQTFYIPFIDCIKLI